MIKLFISREFLAAFVQMLPSGFAAQSIALRPDGQGYEVRLDAFGMQPDIYDMHTTVENDGWACRFVKRD